MREIVVDTETTGLDPSDGHRIIEVGCVELFDHVPTGITFQRYLNPERLIPLEVWLQQTEALHCQPASLTAGV